jgi:hypothetical protein
VIIQGCVILTDAVFVLGYCLLIDLHVILEQFDSDARDVTIGDFLRESSSARRPQ